MELTIFDATRKAIEHQQRGEFIAARHLYDAVLAVAPNFPDALHFYGLLLNQLGEHKSALDYLSRSVEARPDFAPFFSNYASVLQANGELEKAAEVLTTALSLQPIYPEANNNLAVIKELLGELESAEKYFFLAIEQRPNYVTAISNLAAFYARSGRNDLAAEQFHKAAALSGNAQSTTLNKALGLLAELKVKEAKVLFEQVIQMNPNSAEAHLGLAKCFHDMALYPPAETHARRARELAKHNRTHHVYLDSLVVISSTVQMSERHQEALDACRELMELAPNFHFAHATLGSIYMKMGDFERAIEHSERAVELDPKNSAPALNSLGMLSRHKGEIPKSREYFRRAIERDSTNSFYYSNYLFASVYDATVGKDELARIHREIDQKYCKKIAVKPVKYANAPDPDKKIRIGFVSPDIRNHPVFQFVLPLLKTIDRDRFGLYFYYNYMVADKCTAKAESMADGFEYIISCSNEDLVQKIADDQIDILIDPAGHTGWNRLMLFVHKPAPVQVTWLGHPHSTGMSVFDYRISDHFAEPVGMTEHLNSEKLLRMPELFCCFDPNVETWPEVIDHPPADDNDVVTFGCFNTFAKVTPEVIALWCEILRNNTNARLMIETPGLDDEQFRGQVVAAFDKNGIGEDRLVLIGRASKNQYVLYNQIDVALDPFPLNGGTTTFDALWMGVPVITLAGDHFRSRMGATIVGNAGLHDCVVQSQAEYVELATKFATDREYLRKTRENLRERVVESPLMNAKRFTRHFEDAMRGIWREWCEKQTAKKGKKA
ncbi:MAG: tetratricopeptide repeat protein [Burkholderiales bacterium]|nr:tetratricopeptide repeat protein [Burkholderiales bacterium]